MKVTLWQQFSSNHSADFEIVAEFLSAEVAQNSAIEVKKIIDTISSEWRKGNHSIVNKYQLTWTSRFRDKAKTLPQWLHDGALEVEAHGQLLFIRNLGNTLDAQAPLPALLRVLGADVSYIGGDQKSKVFWHFEFKVADTDKATELEETILDYLTVFDKETDVPDAAFDTGVIWWALSNPFFQRTHTTFVLKNLQINYPWMLENLRAFLKWLTEKGATAIECHISEKEVKL